MIRRLGGTAHSDDGFTLVEVIVALTLLMILSAATGLALTSALRSSGNNESRVIAANLVAQKVETLRGMAVSDVPVGVQSPETVVVRGKTYTLTVSTELDTAGGTGSSCDGASGAAAFKAIHVQATWNKMGGISPVRSDTTRALGVNGLSGTTGVLTVPVKDRDGKGVPNIPVTVSLASGVSYTSSTKSDGCAVFNNLAPSASYSARTSVPGWVDRSGVNLVQRSAIQVIANTVTKDPGFVYDRAASLSLTPTRALGAGTEYAFPATMGITTSNSFSGDTPFPICGSAPCVTLTSGRLTTTPVFPFTDGVKAWAGICSTAKPTTPIPVAVSPGQTALGALPPAAAFKVIVKNSGGVAQTGWTMSVTNANCAGESFALPASAATATAVSLPAGQWVIKAVSGSRTVTTTITLTANQILNSGTPVVVLV